ncbi:MAG: extracellular solute-binding protein [Ruminococcus sp.]|nr:extracellular solute-binding protein [Ruminococcus sp.]
MKNTIRKITALTLAVMTLCGGVSCGKNKPEEISDSQEKEENVDTSEKETLTIAVTEQISDISEYVRRFNLKDEPYEINLVNYSLLSEDSDNEFYSDAFNQLKMDLVSGEKIDMVILKPEDMYAMAKNGYLADLYEVMDNNDGLKKEEFLPNVLEGLEFEGKLPAVCESFWILTAVAKESNIGGDMANWTLDEAIDFYNSIPEDSDLIYEMWASMEDGVLWGGNTLENFIMRRIVRDCIDLPGGTCEFGDTFRKAVEFLEGKDLVKSNIIQDPNSDVNVNAWSLINDKAFFNCTMIAGFNAFLTQEVCTVFGGEDITYVGYPSESGCGAITEAGILWGITANSEMKDEAWDLICQRLENGNDSDAVPVLTEKLEKDASSKGTTDNWALRKPQQLPYPEQGKLVTISDETVQKTLDYIKSIRFEPYYASEAEAIVCEEYHAVLAGEKTLDECVEVLENRISIYLSEKS